MFALMREADFFFIQRVALMREKGLFFSKNNDTGNFILFLSDE